MRCSAGGKLAKNFSGLAIFQLASEARLSGSEKTGGAIDGSVYISHELLAALIFSGRLRGEESEGVKKEEET